MLQNLIAAIRIAVGNFYRQNINFFWFFISVLVSAAILIPLINTLRMGKFPKKKERYKISPPDVELKEHAVKSLMTALGITAAENDPESLALFRKMLKGLYPGVHQTLSWDVYGAGSLLFRWPSRTSEQGAPAVFCSHFDITPKKIRDSSKSADEYIEKSLISGPGALGGKCNVIAMLEAVEHLIKTGYAPTKRDIYFAFGHDGESGGQNGMFNITRMFYRKGIRPAFVLYGSGNILPYAITNRFIASTAIDVTEKGRLRLKLVAGQTTTSPKEKQKTIDKKNVKDAKEILAEALSRIKAAPIRRRLTATAITYYRIMAPAMTFWGRFAVGNLPFTNRLFFHMFCNMPGNNPLLKTTISIQKGTHTKHTSEPSGWAEAFLDVKLLNGDTAEFVIDYIRDITSGLPLSVHELEVTDASAVSSSSSDAYKVIYRAAEKRFGKILIGPGISSNANGARYFEKVCDKIYRFAPVLIEGKSLPDQSEECVRDTSLGAAVETYISLIKSAGSEIL